MRITESLRYGGLQNNIENSLDALNTVQSQISTGKKLTQFSDDAAGASHSLVVRAALDDNKQYQRDVTQATAFLSASDSALSSASDLLRSARQAAVQGANSELTPSDYAALGTQVDGIVQQLTQAANSDIHGKYLFGGTATKTPPFDASQNYTGNTGAVTSTLGPNYQITLNTSGTTTFGPAFDALKSLKTDLAAGDATAISADISELDAGISSISAQRSGVGAKLNEVSGVQSRLKRAEGEYGDTISGIEDVDLATAYVQLQSATNVYQASLSTTAKAFQYSLADFLH